MEKIFPLLCLLVLLHNVCSGQPDFRNINWSMSKAQVLASEKKEPVLLDANYIVYIEVPVGVFKADLIYDFGKSGLKAAMYIFREEHSDQSRYYDDYEYLKQGLTIKYGKPIFDDTRWLNELYKDNPQNYGLAASAGHVTFYNTWQKGSNTITLMFSGDNFKTRTTISYKYRFAPIDETTIDTKDF